MGSRSLKDATKSLQVHFSGSKTPLSLPVESRRMLQAFIDDHTGKIEHDEAVRAGQELRHFWQKYVAGNTQKLGAFVGVLRELRPAIDSEDEAVAWYRDVARPIITDTVFKKNVVDDAQEFISQLMIHDEEEESERQGMSDEICRDLLSVYLERTAGVADEDKFVAEENVQVAQQVENCLCQYGRKMPKQLFHHLDDMVVRADTRLEGLTLLSSFLLNQTPHLYTVIHTPLVDSLLKCLMNDTSTTLLSVALTSLIMLLPHIPGSLTPRLPRLFLIYSRLLCWERFSALSTLSQKNLVTDDRYPADDERDNGDVGLDSSWEKARPQEGVIEATTPELMTYYTYLYGLYPLNFMDFIRKPRRYLKVANFPSADEFDLDRAVIRSRSDQFRQAHLLHPNFLNMTIDDEKIDPKWPKMDPADVVADCHGLCVNARPSLLSPGPPPTGRLPPLPPIPSSHNGSLSPAMSLRSGTGSSWRDGNSARISGTTVDPESPILGPEDDGENSQPRSKGSRGRSMSDLRDDFPLPASGLGLLKSTKEVADQPQTNVAYLQREVTLLRNDLNFERWHKSQYSQHIAQLMRKAVKDATVEAETLNLINANRALKQQLDQVRSAREATIKDANLTRKQANSLEHNLTERFQKMKKEQEIWAADMEELRRLRVEMKHYRDLLSASEARELNKSHQLELMQRDLDAVEELQTQLKEARQKIREFEYREFEMGQTQREAEFLLSENATLQTKLQRLEEERELNSQGDIDSLAEPSERGSRRPVSHSYQRSLAASPSSSEPAVLALSQALADAQTKLATLKKIHSRLLEKHADLELEMATIQGYPTHSRHNSIVLSGDASSVMSGALPGRPGVLESIYAADNEIDTVHTTASDPTLARYQDPAPAMSIAKSHPSMKSSSHRTSKPSDAPSMRSNTDLVFNRTKPLHPDERSLTGGSESSSMKEKIKPDSEVRVFGRGGAQNVKLKPVKEKDRAKLEGRSDSKKGISRAFKGLGFSS